MIIHVVKRGDTPYSLSKQYGVPVQKILDDNAIVNPQALVIGQALVIVTDNIRYSVQSGDSLYAISRRFGVPVPRILEANPQISDPSKISVGQEIVIPLANEITRAIDVNGYAYPNINRNTLNSSLPHLTFISIFAYMVNPDGSLSEVPDTSIIQTARQVRVAPLMVVTNIIEGEGFDSDLAHLILTNEQVQNNLIENIIATLEGKNYHGLDIDFEYIYPYDRGSYNQFLRRIVDTLRPLGYTVSTALAPKISANQPGLLYEAHDYPVHGRLADRIILMTYEWGYTYGPPMAVSPIDQVERVLQYAVTVIPSRKILMGIPNYGYDWTLPFVRGSAARSLSNTAAVNLAAQVGAEIKFDTKSQAPFFNYYDSNGRQHVVWFEDARSIEAKLKLVTKYNLGGISVWTLTSFFPQMWWVLNSMFYVNKVL